ncbi:MAG TPA: RidA family protein [Firmicutes bacterium]|nr:RidA family protein [Bacillota bacterium]
MGVEDKIRELGFELPECPKPVAAYVPAVKAGEFVYASGQTAIVDGKPVHPGKLGAGVSIEQGYEAARICALRCLAEIKSVIGDLDKVKQIVKVTGYVASGPGFGDQPKVVNGASELLRQIFGIKGEHSRSAIGVAELPGGACVEVEIIAQV